MRTTIVCVNPNDIYRFYLAKPDLYEKIAKVGTIQAKDGRRGIFFGGCVPEIVTGVEWGVGEYSPDKPAVSHNPVAQADLPLLLVSAGEIVF